MPTRDTLITVFVGDHEVGQLAGTPYLTCARPLGARVYGGLCAGG